jgi:glycosyltransferase involved in cell wall biosynthesis
MLKQMRVLFVHEGLGQFQTLHEYLNAEGLAHSWFLCSTSVYEAHKDKIPNLVPFQVPAENTNSYFYTRNLEARIQRSFLIKKAITELLERTGIDLNVAHGSGGFPLQFFGEFDIPIITYIEFPSFTRHGHDPAYPQPDYATFRDKVFEMTSYHQALCSDLVITPSEYAKKMFPTCLHERIVSQMEGFNIVRKSNGFARRDGLFHIGFSARDLSSAKGFEQFIRIAKAILAVRQDVRFVFCGAPKVLYSYEEAFLQTKVPQDARPESFMHYVLEREGIVLSEDSPFQHVSFATYDEFASFVEAMDMFLYPLQFGSANWGLFELLFRGKVIVASDRCFVPEVIRHNFNGLLCKYDDVDGWVAQVGRVIDQRERFAKLGENALQDAHARFHIKNVASSYLGIFEMAVQRKRVSGQGRLN